MDINIMTIKDYAKVVKIGEISMRRIAKIEGFPCIRIGRRCLILVDQANEWLKENCHKI